MSSGRRSGLNIGLTTLTVLFSIIALTIFAVLSLSTAMQEKELAEKYAQSVINYWAADYRCAEMVSEIKRVWQTGAGYDELAEIASELGGKCEARDGAAYVLFSCAIDDKRQLSAALRLDETITVTEWKTEVRDEQGWVPDDSLPVWQGK